jgi:hypothetical protein
MTSLLDRRPKPEPRTPGWTERLPVVTRSRRPLLLLASGLVIVVSIAIFASLSASANHQTSVLVVVSTIDEGQPITASDLGEARVSISSGVDPIAVSEADRLTGKRASVTIPAGSLLISGDVSGNPAVSVGDVVVGIALKAGQLPAAGVKAGDPVMLILTNGPGTPVTGTSGVAGSSTAAGSATGVLIRRATVFDVNRPTANSSSSTSLLVSVEVPEKAAADVATAAAAGQVSLVLLPAGSASAGASTGNRSK